MAGPVHLHLDLLGGISGDMFIGALLDLHPALADGLDALMASAGFEGLVTLTTAPFSDGVLTGTRFSVTPSGAAEGGSHRTFGDIRETLTASGLPEAVKRAAVDIFALLAAAEGEVHGVPAEEVTFHEVGAWDSIADVVVAAHLIGAVGDVSWSVSAIPLGSGRVKTAHGALPVPAPAVARLLEGFEVLDDGIGGERVTPTGAAILKYIDPVPGGGQRWSLEGSGYGFGTKRFPGISNAVRVLSFAASGREGAQENSRWEGQVVSQLSFDIDDLTPEQLAASLDKLRSLEGVLDVLQFPGYGKKSRLFTQVQVLARPELEEAVITACFEWTSTLGLRVQQVERLALARESETVKDSGNAYRVKVARRPGGTATAKAEMADLEQFDMTEGSLATVETKRRRIESKVLERRNDSKE